MIGCDLLVLGAGPAGCAAAIRARQGGLRVALVEQRLAPGLAPGETLHPGAEVLFEDLGMGSALRNAGFHRHRGIWVEHAGQRHFQAYGADANGPWRGFQVDRALLQEMMQNAVRACGARLLMGCQIAGLLHEDGRVAGVRLAEGDMRARWTIDATGRHAWLASQLGLASETYSPPLRVRFGWRAAQASCTDGQPRIALGPDGWDWEAPLGRDRVAWLVLRRAGQEKAEHGMDMTWRLRPACAGRGYFLAGDCAAQIDPSSSHGMLRALMAGMYAGFLATASALGRAPESRIIADYRDWIRSQFLHDVARLRDMHHSWLASARPADQAFARQA